MIIGSMTYHDCNNIRQNFGLIAWSQMNLRFLKVTKIRYMYKTSFCKFSHKAIDSSLSITGLVIYTFFQEHFNYGLKILKL